MQIRDLPEEAGGTVNLCTVGPLYGSVVVVSEEAATEVCQVARDCLSYVLYCCDAAPTS